MSRGKAGRTEKALRSCANHTTTTASIATPFLNTVVPRDAPFGSRLSDPAEVPPVGDDGDRERRECADRDHGEPPGRGSDAEPGRDADGDPQTRGRGEREEPAGNAPVLTPERDPCCRAGRRKQVEADRERPRPDRGRGALNGRGWSRKYAQTG